MVFSRRSGETITGKIRQQGKIELRVEVAVVEDRGTYLRSHFKVGTYLIPPY